MPQLPLSMATLPLKMWAGFVAWIPMPTLPFVVFALDEGALAGRRLVADVDAAAVVVVRGVGAERCC